MRHFTFVVLLASISALPGTPPAQPAQGVTATYVLQRMHDAYAGQWYHTLTFVQKTTRRRPDGTDAISIWLESVRHTPQTGTQLRIDIGDPKDGRGVLYTADSSWQIRDGKVATITASGNEFLPLIQSVYVQPVERTLAELSHAGFDLKRAYHSTLDGQPVWIVGASNAGDSLAAQFVVDTTRRVLVRMLLARPGGLPPIDVRLAGYVRAGKGWLATKIDMTAGGKPFQTEEYTDWKVDVALPASLFDTTQWTTTPHWGRPKTPSGL